MENICKVCGSDKVVFTKHMKIIATPESVRKRHPDRRITTRRVWYEHVCECGNVWEEETHL